MGTISHYGDRHISALTINLKIRYTLHGVRSGIHDQKNQCSITAHSSGFYPVLTQICMVSIRVSNCFTSATWLISSKDIMQQIHFCEGPNLDFKFSHHPILTRNDLQSCKILMLYMSCTTTALQTKGNITRLRRIAYHLTIDSMTSQYCCNSPRSSGFHPLFTQMCMISISHIIRVHHAAHSLQWPIIN